MDKEDIAFLKELQNEMNAQDKVGQASPRFWVVMQTVREYGFGSEYADNSVIIGEEGEECETDFKSIVEWLHNTLDIDCKYIDDGEIEINDKSVYDVDEVISWLEDNTGYDYFNIVYYKDEERIVQDTMFLTKRECEEHIQANSYHYKNPHSYAMTAWRSPQVARLFKILENSNFDELLEK